MTDLSDNRLPGTRSAARAGTLLLIALAAAGPIGYPLWLAARTRNRMLPLPPEPRVWPGMTVVVPAYLESSIIAAKLDDIDAAEYPGELEVIVVADDPQTADASRRPGVRVIEPETREGKAAALNRGVAAASWPIVVATDANAMLIPGSLCALARWFADPTVGAVAGEKRIAGGHEGAYWRFEAFLKRRESLLGGTIGLVGELAAIRRETYRPLPTDLAVDDLWMALDVIDSGQRIVYEPEAAAREDPSADWREDWERRTRVVSGALDVLWRRREMLRPSRGPVAAQLWGHRLIRQSLGPIAHLLLLVLSVVRAHRSRLAVSAVIGHAIAGRALYRTMHGRQVSGLERIAAQLLFLHAVAFGGMVRYARRDRPALWPKLAR
jgi:cellulose synthase/poly-beta-1,6-N-acetylglucosamine synthase-like glycosyltransferase